MRKYVIMGVPGSGKSLQASWLARDLDLVHISVGDIFRWNVQQHTKMGADVRRIMAAGELVGDDLAEKVTAQRLADHDWNYGFIIDGFPRNARQAEFFLESYDRPARRRGPPPGSGPPPVLGLRHGLQPDRGPPPGRGQV